MMEKMMTKDEIIGRTPEYPNDEQAFKCILKSTFAKDGTPIVGHDYMSGLAFQDLDSNRWYFIDRCKHCGHYCASFTDGEFEHEKEYNGQVTKVGGDS